MQISIVLTYSASSVSEGRDSPLHRTDNRPMASTPENRQGRLAIQLFFVAICITSLLLYFSTIYMCDLYHPIGRLCQSQLREHSGGRGGQLRYHSKRVY